MLALRGPAQATQAGRPQRPAGGLRVRAARQRAWRPAGRANGRAPLASLRCRPGPPGTAVDAIRRGLQPPEPPAGRRPAEPRRGLAAAVLALRGPAQATQAGRPQRPAGAAFEFARHFSGPGGPLAANGRAPLASLRCRRGRRGRWGPPWTPFAGDCSRPSRRRAGGPPTAARLEGCRAGPEGASTGNTGRPPSGGRPGGLRVRAALQRAWRPAGRANGRAPLPSLRCRRGRRGRRGRWGPPWTPIAGDCSRPSRRRAGGPPNRGEGSRAAVLALRGPAQATQAGRPQRPAGRPSSSRGTSAGLAARWPRERPRTAGVAAMSPWPPGPLGTAVDAIRRGLQPPEPPAGRRPADRGEAEGCRAGPEGASTGNTGGRPQRPAGRPSSSRGAVSGPGGPLAARTAGDRWRRCDVAVAAGAAGAAGDRRGRHSPGTAAARAAGRPEARRPRRGLEAAVLALKGASTVNAESRLT